MNVPALNLGLGPRSRGGMHNEGAPPPNVTLAVA